MNKVLLIILILCLSLVYYSYIFKDGEALDFKTTFTELASSVSSFGSSIGSFFKEFIKTFDVAFDSVGNLISLITDPEYGLKQFFTAFMENQKEFFAWCWDIVKNFFTDTLNMDEWLLKLQDSISSVSINVKEYFNGVFADWKTAFEEAKNAINEVMDGITDGASNFWGRFTSWFKGLFA